MSQSTSVSAPASAAARSTAFDELRVRLVPVEEMLGVEEHPQIVLPQETPPSPPPSRAPRREWSASASVTCISEAFATMQTASVPAFTRFASTSSSSARTPGRLVEPNATSVAVDRRSSSGARAKNSSSFGFAPGQPPSIYATPRWSSCSATRSLSSTVSDRPSCCEPSRSVVSKMSTDSVPPTFRSRRACASTVTGRWPGAAPSARHQSTCSSQFLYRSSWPRTAAK